MCDVATDRSAGAEMSVRTVAIYTLLRWSKEGFRFVRYALIGKNGELIFYINSRFKNCPTIVKLNNPEKNRLYSRSLSQDLRIVWLRVILFEVHNTEGELAGQV